MSHPRDAQGEGNKRSERMLESLVHDELRRLPDTEAPAELAVGVLARLDARARRPWWWRSWWEWPRTARGLSLGVFVALALAVCAVPWAARELAAGWGTAVTGGEAAGDWALWLSLAQTLQAAGQALAGNVWFWTVLGGLFGLYLCLVGLGSALWRCLTPAGRCGQLDWHRP